MLILTRRTGQILAIEPRANLDPATPVGELFRDGPIEIIVCRIDCQQVRLGITAHSGLLVMRQELHRTNRPGNRRDRQPHDH